MDAWINIILPKFHLRKLFTTFSSHLKCSFFNSYDPNRRWWSLEIKWYCLAPEKMYNKTKAGVASRNLPKKISGWFPLSLGSWDKELSPINKYSYLTRGQKAPRKPQRKDISGKKFRFSYFRIILFSPPHFLSSRQKYLTLIVIRGFPTN